MAHLDRIGQELAIGYTVAGCTAHGDLFIGKVSKLTPVRLRVTMIGSKYDREYLCDCRNVIRLEGESIMMWILQNSGKGK
jgi:hypothetical protein